MAIDFIKIDRSSTNTENIYAARLVDFIKQLRVAYDQGIYLLEIMNHNHDGNSFVQLEKYFGLPVGKGQEVYDLVNGALGSMEGKFQVDDAKELTERVGG